MRNKLTYEIVQECHAAYIADRKANSIAKLAEKHGVSRQAMGDAITRGSQWGTRREGREPRKNPEFYTVNEVCQVTGLGRATIHRLMAANAFVPKVQLSPGRVAFRVADVAAWVESRQEPSNKAQQNKNHSNGVLNFVIICSDAMPLEVAISDAEDMCAALNEIADTYDLNDMVSITLKRRD